MNAYFFHLIEHFLGKSIRYLPGHLPIRCFHRRNHRSRDQHSLRSSIRSLNRNLPRFPYHHVHWYCSHVACPPSQPTRASRRFACEARESQSDERRSEELP